MGQAIFKGFSKCCGTICGCIIKLLYRFRLYYYIGYLEQIKKIEVLKAKKKYLQGSGSGFNVLYPFCFVFNALKNLWVNVTTSFVADKYSNYLKLMLKKDTREHDLLLRTMYFVLGTFTATLFYYMQTFALQQLDFKTVVLSALVLGVCTIGPQFTEIGKAVSWLMLPVSLATIIRTVIIGVLVVDVQRVAWSNINDNFDRTIKTISCDRKAFSNFIGKIDFNFKAGDMESKKPEQETSFDVNIASKDDPLYTLLKGINEIKKASTYIYQKIMYLLNGMVQIGKSIVNFIKDVAHWITNNPVAQWFKGNILMPIYDLIEAIGSLIKDIGKWFGKQMKKLGLVIKQAGIEFKNFILNSLTVKFVANYNFTATSARNASIKTIFRSAKKRLLETHNWMLVIKNSIVWIMYSWLFKALLDIFGNTLSYVVLFRFIGSYDNLYLTRSFYEYEREQQMKGDEALMPFYLFELAIFVHRKGALLNAIEAAKLFVTLLFDLYIGFYILMLFILDLITYSLTIFIQDLTRKVADDFLDPPLELISEVPFLKNVLTKNGKLATDIEAMKEEIKECIPNISPLDYDLYLRALCMICLLFVLTIAWPYIQRSRSYICETFFPERKKVRAAWLYGHIKLQRIIFKAIVNLVMPQLKMVLFQKAGEINPLQNEIAFVPKEKVFPLFRYWPFSWIAKTLGFVKAKPKCTKCPKVIDPYNPKTGIKCPNTSVCEAYYCFQCYNNLKRICEVCRAEIREIDDNFSEEIDSSADEWDDL